MWAPKSRFENHRQNTNSTIFGNTREERGEGGTAPELSNIKLEVTKCTVQLYQIDTLGAIWRYEEGKRKNQS